MCSAKMTKMSMFFSVSLKKFCMKSIFHTSDYSDNKLTLEERDFVSLISQQILKVYFFAVPFL